MPSRYRAVYVYTKPINHGQHVYVLYLADEIMKEGMWSTFGIPLNEANRQNLLRIPRHFDNITRNKGACIKHFGENVVHTVTFDIHRHPDVSTLDSDELCYLIMC